MSRGGSLFVRTLAVSLSACMDSTPVPADLALTHVAVVDVDSGRVIPDRTVLIAGNRIVAVGPSVRTRAAAGARVVEASGKYLIPGLWDMHVHSSSDRITRETILPLYAANGVTGVRDMKGDCFDPCDALESSMEQVRRWRQEIAAGTLVGPRIVASSPLIQSAAGRPSSAEAPATEPEARAVVRLVKDRGVDFIKIYSRLSREAYFALADEAAKQGIPFAGHVPIAVRASEASDAGQRSVEHPHAITHECSTREDELRRRLLTEGPAGSVPLGTMLAWMSESFSEGKCAALYERFVRNGTWYVPTFAAAEKKEKKEWHDDPRLKYVTADEREYWRETLQRDLIWFPLDTRAVVSERQGAILGAMHRTGVSILAGSDVGTPFVFAGFGLHDELDLLVKYGLTEADALRSATLNPARFLEATDSLGAVKAGKLADLVLLDANPLDDIRNTRRISAVVLNGRYLDRAALDRLLAQVEAAAGAR